MLKKFTVFNVSGLILAASVCYPVVEAKTSHLQPTTSVMHEIFEPISLVLPLVYDIEQFESPARKQEILSYLERLDTNAKVLEKHSRDKAGDFKFVSTSFARDIHDALTWFKDNHNKEARFVLSHITENCLTCHAKLPAKGNYPGSEDFIKKINQQKLPALELARLQLTTRRFSDAMSTYEQAFLNKEIRPASWITYDALTQYLRLTVVISENVKRAHDLFENILKERKDVPEYLKKHLDSWRISLKEIQDKKLTQTTEDLNQIKTIIDAGNRMQNFPADRSGLAYYVLASSLLERYVTAPKQLPKESTAEAYFLLGVVEMNIGRSFWISQTDNYLELSIREAPKSPVAQKAYNLLEENIYYEFTGSSGTQIPTDKQVLLTELATLIKPVKPAATGAGPKK